ncbi:MULTISPECIES: hypothetical protein [unclassified Microcoleus]|uniref:hypothetical protein n=1 Tax=unclassified Microcoleus TaxID=2642155 RepID=UPI0025DFFC4E|nr:MULTISPECIES: hypothetical protein [unclassified Microcoleus]
MILKTFLIAETPALITSVNCQLSTVNCQLVCCQLSTVNSSFFLIGYCQRGSRALKLTRANKCRQIKPAPQTLKDNLDFTQ